MLLQESGTEFVIGPHPCRYPAKSMRGLRKLLGRTLQNKKALEIMLTKPQVFEMEILRYLTITLFAIWCVSEIVISLISDRNKSRDSSNGADKFSFFIVWFSTVPPILLAYLIRKHSIFANGFGSFSTLFPLLGYLGCLFIAFGITTRVIAVATL